MTEDYSKLSIMNKIIICRINIVNYINIKTLTF